MCVVLHLDNPRALVHDLVTMAAMFRYDPMTCQLVTSMIIPLSTGGPRCTASKWRSRSTQIWRAIAPSGIGIAVGMYVAPKYTIPRVIGSIIEQVWLALHPDSHGRLMVVVASGLVLGEGTAASVTAVIQAFRVHPS